MQNELFKELKNASGRKNLSQEQLAELLGVSRQAVSKWEQANGYPETETVIQIAEKLNVSLDLLLLNKQTGLASEGLSQNAQEPTSPDKKILIKCGAQLSACFKFVIDKYLIPFKGKRYYLHGVDSRGFWGDNYILLGGYATEEEAKKELDEIYVALQNGETTYELKYHIES